MTDLSTELGRKMRELADTGHPLAEELRAAIAKATGEQP